MGLFSCAFGVLVLIPDCVFWVVFVGFCWFGLHCMADLDGCDSALVVVYGFGEAVVRHGT